VGGVVFVSTALLNGGVIAVLGDSYWSRGLVLRVLSREKFLRGSICFYYQMSVGKRILKIMVKVDTAPSLASSTKKQNVT
jgi:hypothetical protein